MKESDFTDPETQQIQSFIDSYLALHLSRVADTAAVDHPDDDILSAFAEGTLTAREAGPAVAHLAKCSFCRGITAELVRLEMALDATESMPPAAVSEQPSRISDVLSGIVSRILGSSEGAVFAHNEDEKAESEPEKDLPDGDK
jgi:hypothetical protein